MVGCQCRIITKRKACYALEAMQQDEQFATTLIWDPVLRSTHWSLALFFSAAYWSGGDWLGLHAHFGYCLALLVIFRIYWGWTGTHHAKFANFVVSLASVLGYVRQLKSRATTPFDGHDPLGGWMIILLLTTLLATAFSGILLFALEQRGPLAGTWFATLPGGPIEAFHHLTGEVSLYLVCLHVVGVFVMSWYTRQRLVRAMISGRKV